MSTRLGRPDLAEIRAFAASVIGPGLWWSENVPAVRALFEQAMGFVFPLLGYIAALEQDAAGLDAALQRWIAACDAFDDAKSGSWGQHEAWMEACEAELAVKTLARAGLLEAAS